VTGRRRATPVHEMLDARRVTGRRRATPVHEMLDARRVTGRRRAAPVHERRYAISALFSFAWIDPIMNMYQRMWLALRDDAPPVGCYAVHAE
ncbi:MAG: hypothetical protein ABI456_06950, partial [Ktedonobacteraceae bacterium]